MENGNSLGAGLTPEMRKNLFGNADLNMLWHCPSDPRFPYWVHLPDWYYDEKTPSYQLMVIIHGTGCAVEGYLKEARELADAHHMALIAEGILLAQRQAGLAQHAHHVARDGRGGGEAR